MRFSTVFQQIYVKVIEGSHVSQTGHIIAKALQVTAQRLHHIGFLWDMVYLKYI